MKRTLVVILGLSLLTTPLFAVDQFDSEDPTQQAREDYRAYLQQLRTLNRQYKQVTGEIKKILEEEGIPVWDENTGGLEVKKFNEPDSAPSGAFGNVDIEETEKDMIARVDMPGVKKDMIKVKIQDGKFLHISGERSDVRKKETQTQGSTYTVAERQYGSFERTIELPAQALEEGIEARYEDGVLTVKIPKATSPKKEVSIPVK